MSKLRFTVAACSGEDPAFPARELNEHAASSKGFLTPKNCEYPQELVLKLLDGPCRITQVQLLSHQTHIATKIELFLSKSSALSDASFQRLGFLTLKSNVESNYMARELKTVHIDNDATLVKLLLHQCYINERNMYSQVGVMAINLLGAPLAAAVGSTFIPDELPSQSVVATGAMRSVGKNQQPPTKPPGANSSDDLSFDLRFDAKTAARIREIQVAKDHAVAMEDYDQAKRLKQTEEQLKSIGLQLARLDAAKRDAVANEDYDAAKRIKDEISLLEASVGSNELQPIVAHATGATANASYDAPISSNARAAHVRNSQVLPRAAAAIIGGTKATASSSSFSPRDMYPDDPRQQQQQQQRRGFAGDQSPHHRPSSSSSSSNRYAPPATTGNADDAYDDNGDAYDNDNAHSPGGGGRNPHFRGIPDAETLDDPEEIPAALAKENEQLIDVIGMFFTRCLYSNVWNHRDAAIRKVTIDLEQYATDPLQLLEVCSTLVQCGAGDRTAQVALSAFRLFERMLPFAAKVRRDDMCHILGNSMTQVVTKLGEPQTKVRDEAAALLVRLASTKNVGVNVVTSHVVKRSKKPLGVKFLQGRLLVLKDLVSKFELLDDNDSDHSMSGILSFLEDANCFAHPNKEIREPAKELTVALYLLVGPDVESYLKSLRPKQLEEYQAAFEAAETAKAANARAAAATGTKRSSGTSNTTNAHSAASNGAGRQTNARQPAPSAAAVAARLPDEMVDDNDDDDDDESVDEYTCPFCGIVDDTFDSERLDHHFWAACRMLSPCKMCGQVIEIACLNEHLLVECERKRNHRACPRCGEAITTKFFDQHVALNDCAPAPHPQDASRCPLCHDDIAPGKRGWRDHLMLDGCPNNPRS